MFCRITSDPIDSGELVRQVRSDSDGAVVLFVGVVRDNDFGRPVVGLKYEAYEEMATHKLTQICKNVIEHYELGDMAAVHRVGDLAVGDVSVAVAVAAPHREAAYRASREVIERLKHEVPIWKRERYAGGEEAWVEGRIPGTAQAE